MNKGKNKVDKKVKNKKELLKIIEEKEVEIENQKIRLQSANQEIEKIKVELKELKDDISNSIKGRTNNKSGVNSGNRYRGIGEREKNSISIEIVEVNENKDKSLEASKDENIDGAKNYKEKLNTNEILTKEIEDSSLLMKNLKSVFIENKNYETIENFNKILENINFIENSITDAEKVLLIYLGYFYNKLEELLSKSKVINKCYNSDINEVNLLKMILKEKEYNVYEEEEEVVPVKIRYDKDLFSGLDVIIKIRLVDKISNISYRVFEGVYSVKDLKYGEENITLKAWVKEKGKNKYRLVEGLYCETTQSLYMLESSICVLGLNIKKLTPEKNKGKNTKENKIEYRPYREKKANFSISLEEKCEFDNFKEEYYMDEEDDYLNIWERFKKKFVLK